MLTTVREFGEMEKAEALFYIFILKLKNRGAKFSWDDPVYE